MRKRVFAGIGMMLCFLGGCSHTPTSYEIGIKNLEEKNYTEAIENFQDAVEAEDHTAESWRGIGVAWTEKEVYDKAQEAFEAALDQVRSSDQSMKRDISLYLADAQYHQKDYKGCLETCNTLLEDSREKDGFFLRGSAYLQLKEYNQAEKDFSRVIEDSEDYQDYLDIYMVYRDCGLNADGSVYLEKAAEIKPGDGEDYYQRGRVYYYLGDYENAEKDLERATEKDYPMAQIYLGKVYLTTGDAEKARETYEQCLDAADLKAEAYNGLAYCSIQEEDYESALSYVQEGLKEEDSDEQPALLFNEIIIYEKMADYDSAKEKINEYLELYPGDINAVRENYLLETR